MKPRQEPGSQTEPERKIEIKINFLLAHEPNCLVDCNIDFKPDPNHFETMLLPVLTWQCGKY